MPQSFQRTLTIVAIVLSLLGAAFATTALRPHGPLHKEALAVGNWGEYGLIALRGWLVFTPKKLTPTEVASPPRFHGHNGYSLLPTYFAYALTGSPFAASLLATLALSACFAAAIFFAFEPAARSWPVIAAICLSPAFLRESWDIDPVAASLLWAVPMILFFVGSVARNRGEPRLLWPTLIMAIAAALNWTVAIAFAVWAPVFLFLIWKSNYRGRVVASLAFVAAVSAAVTVWLFLDKMSLGGAGSSSASGYFAGGGGYGAVISWGTVIKRLSIATVVGLLPAWALLMVRLRGPVQLGLPFVLLCAAPAMCSVAIVLVLRNYASHSQWIVASPIALNGVLASLFLCRAVVGSSGESASEPARDPVLARSFTSATLIGITLAYGLVFVIVFQQNIQGLNSIHALAGNSRRHDVIFVEKHQPNYGRLVEDDYMHDLSYQLGRECYLLTEARVAGVLAEGRGAYLFTDETRKLPVFAETQPSQTSLAQAIQRMLQWYRKHVSRQTSEHFNPFDTPHRLYDLRGGPPSAPPAEGSAAPFSPKAAGPE